MCGVFSWRLEPRPLPLLPTNIYTCRVIIALRVCGNDIFYEYYVIVKKYTF